jgi:hypothetical protein
VSQCSCPLIVRTANLPSVLEHITIRRKVTILLLSRRNCNLHLTYLQLWVPGVDSRERSNCGEESQKGHIDDIELFPLPLNSTHLHVLDQCLVQSAKAAANGRHGILYTLLMRALHPSSGRCHEGEGDIAEINMGLGCANHMRAGPT